MTKKASVDLDVDLEDGDEVNLPPDEEDASAEDLLGGDESVDEFLARNSKKDSAGDDDTDDEESQSSAEGSQSKDSQAKGSQTSEVAQLLQVVQAQSKQIDALMKGNGSNSDTKESNADAILPDEFGMEDEVPEGFEGIGDYLKGMGSKLLGFHKSVLKEVQSTKNQIKALEVQIEVESQLRELGLTRAEEKKIGTWAEKNGFNFRADKIPGIVELYKQIHKDEGKPKAKGKNSNPPTPGNQTRVTRTSENNAKPKELTGDQEWEGIVAKSLRETQMDRLLV